LTASQVPNADRTILITNSWDENAGKVFGFHPFLGFANWRGFGCPAAFIDAGWYSVSRRRGELSGYHQVSIPKAFSASRALAVSRPPNRGIFSALATTSQPSVTRIWVREMSERQKTRPGWGRRFQWRYPLLKKKAAGSYSRAVAISIQPLIFHIFVLCRFFAHSFAAHAHRNASIHVPQLKLSKRRKKRGRHVGITQWLLVWLIANALFVVWRVLVVSQAESRDLSVRREGAGRPLSQQALRERLGR